MKKSHYDRLNVKPRIAISETSFRRAVDEVNGKTFPDAPDWVFDSLKQGIDRIADNVNTQVSKIYWSIQRNISYMP